MKLFAGNRHQQGLTDPWSAVHFSAGLTTGLADVPMMQAVVFAVLTDAAIGWVTQSRSGLLKRLDDEPAANKVIDILLFAVGNQLGRRWNGD